MATGPKTLQQIQDAIHAILEGDSDTPATSDDEWQYRTTFINNAISEWESDEGILWNELWTQNNAGGTLAAGTVTYPATDDFRFIGGYLNLYDGTELKERIRVVKPERVQSYPANSRIAYVTGNPSEGYTVNLAWTPAATDPDIGYTLKYDYYKFADTLSATTDVPEMANPNFLVHTAIAQEHLINDNLDGYSVHAAKAQSFLQGMVQMNDLAAHYQGEGIEDVAFSEDGLAFGV